MNRTRGRLSQSCRRLLAAIPPRRNEWGTSPTVREGSKAGTTKNGEQVKTCSPYCGCRLAFEKWKFFDRWFFRYDRRATSTTKYWVQSAPVLSRFLVLPDRCLIYRQIAKQVRLRGESCSEIHRRNASARSRLRKHGKRRAESRVYPCPRQRPSQRRWLTNQSSRFRNRISRCHGLRRTGDEQISSLYRRDKS